MGSKQSSSPVLEYTTEEDELRTLFQDRNLEQITEALKLREERLKLLTEYYNETVFEINREFEDVIHTIEESLIVD